ncbi:hypothetical protein POF50_007430 [Streptomyces sp. SL13]|uniref:Uncharacterized protein n=1 Tax=Streptantibioticus silvisoli TaxID=2705255 RepID=A0AA90JWJ9_9ACTN|nr:DUF6882 domain-containing protein [Streptantibioticus silvisoli]MDI5962543.1 hypothetical protein [Streptantibioticus silvisoli]MDI5969176.1 hypothetical protein [Streptantibioticus silvisoli]
MITTFSDAFGRATERHAAWAAQQLQSFTGFLPDGEWSADLDTCRYRQGGRDLRISMLGTFSEEDGSWLWGWANPGFQGSPVTRTAGTLREIGTRYGVPEFAERMVPLAGFPDVRRAVEMLAFGAMGVLGAAGYVGVEAGPGTRLYLLADDPAVPRAAPEAVVLPRVLMYGVELLDVPARPVVAGYFEHHGLPWHESEESISAALPSGATAEVRFDAAGRIASVQVASGGVMG